MVEWLTNRFELSRGGGAHNLRPMEGLRGFAVFLVFLVHYAAGVQPLIVGQSALLVTANALRSVGFTGVDLFFVLSGYLIYGSLISRPQQLMRFISRRVVRIYPAFIVVFAIYVVMSFVFPAENKIPQSLIGGSIYLLLNFLLLPGLFPIVPMITVAWSLSYEMFFYLAIPFVITVFWLRQRSVLWRISFFSSVVVATILYCAAYGGHVSLTMFVSGMLVHEAIVSRRVPAPGSAFALLALVVGLLATLLPIANPIGYALRAMTLFASFFVLCFCCFSRPTAWLPCTFSWTPLRWLGNMSYSYYLLHGLALKASFLALAKYLPTGTQEPLLICALLPVMFALTLIPTGALFLLVERPFSLTPRHVPGGLGLASQANNPGSSVKVESDA